MTPLSRPPNFPHTCWRHTSPSERISSSRLAKPSDILSSFEMKSLSCTKNFTPLKWCPRGSTNLRSNPTHHASGTSRCLAYIVRVANYKSQKTKFKPPSLFVPSWVGGVEFSARPIHPVAGPSHDLPAKDLRRIRIKSGG